MERVWGPKGGEWIVHSDGSEAAGHAGHIWTTEELIC